MLLRWQVVLVALLSLLVLNLRLYAATETQVVDVSSAAGTAWEFQPEGGAWKSILVPAGGWRAQGYTCDAGTYRASITIPASAAGRQVKLALAAVNFGAQVSAGVDDSHLTPVASHINGWMPFAADLTSLAVPGGKLLVQVEVQGRKKFMVKGKYTVPEGATWCPSLEEGIIRGITLELLPPVHIDDVWVRASRGPDTLRAQVTLTNDTNTAATVALQGTLSSAAAGPGTTKGMDYPAVPAAQATLAPHRSQTIDLGTIAWPLGAASYWWPNVPYRADYVAQLHQLAVTAQVEGQAVHQVIQRFGFRTFAAVGNHYELNGIPCNLRGDNQQEADFGTDAYGVKKGFGPPTADNPGWPQAVDNLLRLNFNVLRIHQVPATPYMLDVCDQKGLMLVAESPLRGSEGGEDYKNGKDNMLNMDREMVRRDRHHPAIVIWSAANEWKDPIRDAIPVIQAVDDTRPIIADGVGDMGPDVINMEHYKNGLGGMPVKGGEPRADRPYGETEAVWFADNSWQGFAWMATTVRTRRLLGNADLRNYVLNNAWSNYVPGESDQTEIIEVKVKNFGNGSREILPALADPWNHPNIRLLQQCYHPLAACDVEFDQKNARSNVQGQWPVYKPRLASGTHVVRKLAVCNDEFAGEDLALRWELRRGTKAGAVLASGEQALHIPLGHIARPEIAFDAPAEPAEVVLLLRVLKDGKERFVEDQLVFRVAPPGPALADGNYLLLNAHSGLAAVVKDASDQAGTPVVQGPASGHQAAVWQLKHISGDDVMLTNKKTGLVLAVAGGSDKNEALIVQEKPTGQPNHVWHLATVSDETFTLTNKASGKLFDVYASATKVGSRIVQWEANGGDNQQWQLQEAP